MTLTVYFSRQEISAECDHTPLSSYLSRLIYSSISQWCRPQAAYALCQLTVYLFSFRVDQSVDLIGVSRSQNQQRGRKYDNCLAMSAPHQGISERLSRFRYCPSHGPAFRVASRASVH